MRLLIAGGGTGGHVFPALAVAQALVAQDPHAEVLFVGTQRGFEARAVPAAGHEIVFIEISGVKGMGVGRGLRSLIQIPKAGLRSRQILRSFNPDVVLGVGGYASGPVVATAALLGIPTAICEQNSVPGLTNRILAKMVRAIFGSFAHSQGFFPSKKFTLVGNPVRREIIETEPQAADNGAPLRVLVLGGSQGARPLNQALPKIFAAWAATGRGLMIRHQSGAPDLDSVRQAYAGLGLSVEVTAFIDDMASAYGQADLVVGRAGATTCAELTALGIPALLIPFPQAADDHQTLNARDLEQVGAAMILPQAELDSDAALTLLTSLDEDSLQSMRLASQRLGRPQAADDVVRALHTLATGEKIQGREEHA